MEIFNKIFSIKLTDDYIQIYILFIKVSFRRRINNSIYLIKDNKKKKVRKIKGLKVNFYGSNSVIEIGNNPCPKFVNCCINCGDESHIFIDDSEHKIQNMYINSLAKQNTVNIGKNFNCVSIKFMNGCCTGLSVKLGDNVIASNNVYIRPTDGHTIYDLKTKKVLNPSEDIEIGNHVWLGRDTKILKGAKIPADFVIGANSIVTKGSTRGLLESGEGGVLVGAPAKLIKSGIGWERKSPSNFGDYVD